ncbi:hypothetical protein MKK68_24170 [Methylobacterium sp. E-016]|uniref:hypothetical protein n=1 Tax=Methylobacterium sp. E-016 TaxID=2836556 RepID=UPI001FB894D0|nr:hypothetical protein [Methylobacterium sp. E-016]MCJ2078702.1 hypothetical protein [Methylobacterium sp. E-016]
MQKFFYPLKYFRLQNREKRLLDVVPTIGLSLLIWAPFYLLEGASFFRPNGFLDKILSLAGALTGFYIAALVAAATFVHPDLDKVIKSGPVALVEKDNDGHKVQVALTRREFACTIFGYLSFAALVVSIGCAIAVGLSSAKIPALLVPYKQYIRFSIMMAYSIAISHLVVVTSLGLYYLMDRLYRHDRQVTSKKPAVTDKAA